MVMLDVRAKRAPDVLKLGHEVHSGEAMAFCPLCKTFQTVWINGNRLMPTRKFSQINGQIYHDCGSRRPCRLYPNW
jgi:hypothetical protein